MSKIVMGPEKGPVPILAGYPTIMVGANVDGKPDFATVAWTGVAASIPPTITVALQHHRYSLKGIRQNMTFSVNIPSADLVKETDYCGLVSGANSDKAADCHFKVFYGKLTSAPLIEQCPVNHACEVIQILNLGSHELIVGKIVETHISEDCMTNGRFDAVKAKPFFFAGKYYTLGEPIGDAFRIGRDIDKAKADDAVARDILLQTGYYLGMGIASIIKVLDPEAVIIGGHITNAWQIIYPEIMQALSRRAFSGKKINIFPTSMPSDSTLIGAATFAIREFFNDFKITR